MAIRVRKTNKSEFQRYCFIGFIISVTAHRTTLTYQCDPDTSWHFLQRKVSVCLSSPSLSLSIASFKSAFTRFGLFVLFSPLGRPYTSLLTGLISKTIQTNDFTNTTLQCVICQYTCYCYCSFPLGWVYLHNYTWVKDLCCFCCYLEID